VRGKGGREGGREEGRVNLRSVCRFMSFPFLSASGREGGRKGGREGGREEGREGGEVETLYLRIIKVEYDRTQLQLLLKKSLTTGGARVP